MYDLWYCKICNEELHALRKYKSGNPIVKTRCGHKFHKPCIREFLMDKAQAKIPQMATAECPTCSVMISFTECSAANFTFRLSNKYRHDLEIKLEQISQIEMRIVDLDPENEETKPRLLILRREVEKLRFRWMKMLTAYLLSGMAMLQRMKEIQDRNTPGSSAPPTADDFTASAPPEFEDEVEKLNASMKRLLMNGTHNKKTGTTESNGSPSSFKYCNGNGSLKRPYPDE